MKVTTKLTDVEVAALELCIKACGKASEDLVNEVVKNWLVEDVQNVAAVLGDDPKDQAEVLS